MRKRRTAEEARRVIMDATAARLKTVGPGGIRLQEVAADVGMSHPAILHHFGTREGLVDAVLTRSVTQLRADLVRAMSQRSDAAGTEPADATDSLVQTFETLGQGGHAQLLAWLALAKNEGRNVPEVGHDQALRVIALAVHALRRASADKSGEGADKSVEGTDAPKGRGNTPSVDTPSDDTTFLVMLGAFAMFGDAIVGDIIRRSAGLEGDEGAQDRFRRWLAELLVAHSRRPDTSA